MDAKTTKCPYPKNHTDFSPVTMSAMSLLK